MVPSQLALTIKLDNNKQRTTGIVILSIMVAMGVRLWYGHLQVVDFWGDSYHHWLISRLILANHWIYIDYKGMETIWLPGYHYLVSVVMFLWQRFDLAPAYLINTLLGTLTCGFVAWLVIEVSKNGWAGLVAGLTLAMLPWHVAYSHINMPEVASGLLLLLIFTLARNGHYAWLSLLAFISALNRHELTFLLAILGGWLLWQRQWRVVLGLSFGTLFALVTWSTWSWYITGDALAWWTRSQVAAAWDAQFGIEAGIRPMVDFNQLKDTLLQVYPPLYVTSIAFLLGLTYKSWCARMVNSGWLLAMLVVIHWLFLGFFMVGHLPTLEPRFFLITLPLLVCVGSLVIAAIPRRKTRGLFWGLQLVFLLFSVGDLPEFAKKAYIISPERAAGEYLGAIASEKGNFWVDAPTSIYYSGLSPKRFFSSEQLLPDEKRWLENTPELALAAIEKNDIRYILWEEVSYTFVGQVWPAMAAGQAFEQNGYRFEPVFRYSGWELKYGAKPTVLWQVKSGPR